MTHRTTTLAGLAMPVWFLLLGHALRAEPDPVPARS